MLLWELLASGQIRTCKVNGWANLSQPITLGLAAGFGNNHTTQTTLSW